MLSYANGQGLRKKDNVRKSNQWINPGKRSSRRIAKRVGGRRIPVTGERDGADVIAGAFGLSSETPGAGCRPTCATATRITAAGERKNATGIVVWKAPRALDDDAVVILRLQDWQKLHGRKKKRPTTIKPSVQEAVPGVRGTQTMDESQHHNTPNPYQPLLFAPAELLACGLRDAHHYPLVGERTAAGVRSWRSAPEKAWEHTHIELARTANSYCSVVLDCDSEESIELACAVRAGYGDLPLPNFAARREASGHLQIGWHLLKPVHRGATARPRPLSVLARIAEFYADALSSDRNYVGVCPTTRSTAITSPSIRALIPTTWLNWPSRSRRTGGVQRARWTWQPNRGATAICSMRYASWHFDVRMTGC